MNTVIINTIRNRFKTDSSNDGQMKGSDKQIVIILLLVTFSYLALTTPGYVMLVLTMYIDFQTSPKVFADFFLLYNASQKLYYTNNGINFLLYVISGQKFRQDLIGLFIKRKVETPGSVSAATSMSEI